MEGDELEIELRSSGDVARRMVILAALVRLATAFSDDDSDEHEVSAEIRDIRDALTLGPFDAELAPSERALLQRRDLDESDILRLSWQVEALQALAWACGVEAELPPPWRMADAPGLIARMPDPWDDLDGFATHFDLAGDEEAVAEERERAEVWLWRALIADEFATADDEERREITAIVREAARESAEAGHATVRAGDFEVERKPFSQVDPETVALITEVSRQRLVALNWLCGFGENWDDVPLDL